MDLTTSDLPNEKTQKYDRQLRLWGDHGQALLESSKVCLVNATATGCEVLKNLILPGIGSFVIIDDGVVDEQDLGNNFFLTTDSLNQKRGKVACQYLQELNGDVDGSFLDESIGNLLKRSPECFLKFNLVIVSHLPTSVLLSLDEVLYKHDIPLMVCKSYGMIGYLRLVAKNHVVIESHPDHPLADLRLTNPFAELKLFCDAVDLNTLDRKQHSHMPWIVILYKFLEEYKVLHGGEVPKTYQDKKELKALISKGMRRNEEGIQEDEENFEEAMKAVNTALTNQNVPSRVQEIIDHPLVFKVNAESKNFWILVKALKEFVEAHGCLPLQGSIPDMTADSETYVALQHVYKEKAQEHQQELFKRANRIKSSFQSNELLKPLLKPTDQLTSEDVKLFCKNAANLNLIDCRSINEEYSIQTARSALIASRLEEDGEADDFIYYILLRASEMFYTEYSRYPGCYDDQIEADIPLLKGFVSKLLHDMNVTGHVREDYLHEMCSYGGSELHSVAAYMGGVAAQEAIKLITRQYLPIRNTYIYNACSQTSTTLDL